MKKQAIHPVLRKVAFQDMATGEIHLIESAIQTHETVQLQDGQTYPLVKIDISSSSHPVYTGKAAPDLPSSRREMFNQKYSRTLH